MDDPHRKPREKDRDQLVARVRRAADEGRISAADRDIRLTNIGSARSMADLDLIGRDLDQVEALAPTAVTVTAGAGAPPGQPTATTDVRDSAGQNARVTTRAIAAVVALVLAIGVGVASVIGFAGGSQSATGTSAEDLLEPEPIPVQAPGGDPGDPGDEEPSAPGTAYALTGPAIRDFLGAYQQRFGTTEVVSMTLYGDYVIVDVPVPGKARHEGWIYRPASGFTSFGGVTANRQGDVPVDTRRLDVPALMRNVARARSTLNVEDPTTTYVIVRHYSTFDEVPSVDIHVGNEFRESGYLATHLDGTVERAYPFAS